MKRTPRVLVPLSLCACLAIQIACATAPPANTGQPTGNANATPSNSSPAKAPQEKTAASTGTIEVTSMPPGARVLLISTDEDGAGEPQSKGLTPATITGVRPGKYTVHLEKEGYRFFQKEITVKQGATVKINTALKKK